MTLESCRIRLHSHLLIFHLTYPILWRMTNACLFILIHIRTDISLKDSLSSVRRFCLYPIHFGAVLTYTNFSFNTILFYKIHSFHLRFACNPFIKFKSQRALHPVLPKIAQQMISTIQHHDHEVFLLPNYRRKILIVPYSISYTRK